MKKATWRKQHKWLGLGISFFLLVFCVSGVLLNHRSLINDVNVSRAYLPSRYEYRNWNGGLLKGTLDLSQLSMSETQDDVESNRNLLLYGNGGIWLTDTKATFFKDFNEGLPLGADFRQIKNVVKIDSNNTESILFAVSPFRLYRSGIHGPWHEVKMPLSEGERLADVTCHGDTLVVLSRSFAYTSLPPYTSFRRIQLHAPKGYDGRVTAFRTIWMLHSGELFGTFGKLVVDGIAVILVVLCVTGFVLWLRPKRKYLLKASFNLHNKIGRATIVFTLLVAITGWCLRPPVMIALALTDIPALPGTTLKSENPWNDKLRMIGYDETTHDWLLSTSEGFYSLTLRNGEVEKIDDAPPVSVMGLNVMQQNENGKWYCGSFSGLYVWDRQHGTVIDYFTGQSAPKQSGVPFAKNAVAGMSRDFSIPVVAEYDKGTSFAPQPAAMNQLPMSLWNVALEVHSGRIFIGSIATYLFVFVMGLLIIWCLWSGYR